MKTRHILFAFCGMFALMTSVSRAGDWVTARSYFTHDPQTGQPVQQYAPIGPFYTQAQGNYQRSGFHHTRSSIQVGSSMDNYHVVETYGDPVRPYGEWRFPFRPYSVPSYLSTPRFRGGGFGGYGGGFRGGGGGVVPPIASPGPILPGGSVPPPAGPGSAPGRPGAGLFDLYPEREGHHLPFNTPDPYQREKLMPSDSPRLPRPDTTAP
ncbi:MAG: hypothetical protein QF918_09385 [Pirellulaceae bacterium]|jgi:hypothetical protein|nr:hypothetical protein [Pirellulaceae bacterium]MDP6556887.1 hypothetical protein [Pirellulaceae bacterium]MDP6717229.1 hypothetical protein [Pirellulaceae bacterium]